MGKFSRDKGKRGERAFVSLCHQMGYDTRRTAQVRGNDDGAADVEGLPGVHVEVKWQEHMHLYDWMAQSVRDAEKGDCGLPIVAHKKSNAGWLITQRAEDWFTIYREWDPPRTLEDRIQDTAKKAMHDGVTLQELLERITCAYGYYRGFGG